MALRLIGTDDANPRLPVAVINATQGPNHADLAPGDVGVIAVFEANAYTDQAIADVVAGGIDFADNTETLVGTSTAKAVNPAGLAFERPYVDVRSFGAKGDGVTDDTAAIQTAIDTVGAAGGGTVLVPKGTFLVNTAVTANGSSWVLTVKHDNVCIVGVGDASILRSTLANARVLAVFGPARTNPVAAWDANQLPRLTAYTMTAPLAKGATSLTVSPADAANLAVDDWIYIRTGQLIAASTDQPDAELNRVASVNTGTGAIGLVYPTGKPYVQEYFISGTTGLTSTTVTANPAVFGVAKANNHLVHGCVIANLQLQATDANQLLSIWQAVDVEVVDVRIKGRRAPIGSQSARDVRISRVNAIIDTGLDSSTWFCAPSTGCSQWTIDNCTFSGVDAGYLHLHEGCAKVTVSRCRFLRSTCPAGVNFISMRARGYDFKIRDCHIENRSTNAFVLMFIDNTILGGGEIIGNTFAGGSGVGNAIRVDQPGWKIVNNRIDQGTVSVFQTTGEMPVEFAQGWVLTTATNPTLGAIPAYARVVSVYLEVTQAFNSDGTDNISVGYTGSPAAYATNTDVSTTGIKTVILGTGVGFSATARTLTATYTAGGSAPTTGKALIIVGFQRCPRES